MQLSNVVNCGLLLVVYLTGLLRNYGQKSRKSLVNNAEKQKHLSLILYEVITGGGVCETLT